MPGLQLSAIPGESPIGGCRSSGNPSITNSMVCSSPDRRIDGCLYVRATFVFWDAISNPLGFLVISENPYAVISFEMASFKPLFPPGRHTHPSPLSTQGYKYTSLLLFRILIPIKQVISGDIVVDIRSIHINVTSYVIPGPRVREYDSGGGKKPPLEYSGTIQYFNKPDAEREVQLQR